ncbi:DUF7453 family protein [Bythopirellula goksoeyrii]|uniref:PEP-CTERM protein-sorting domain-containing protein n=1 Tax=Bythopirellula goksoeyrii TaxID=1400387 RepID=A0A5B9QKR2_9BACT|nr:choice-of-anchor tandem repeat NxxGxxAF-containing protein [Bythopirellula goksoeyrii]QEG37626.1 hypothetical protein Pr1d_49720 [Bythopirellula goksoeyrii]
MRSIKGILRGALLFALPLAVVVMVTLGTSAAANAGSNTKVVAVTLDPAPDGNGIIVIGLTLPKLNDIGQAAFSGFISNGMGGNPSDNATLLSDGNTLAQVAREGQSAPDGNGILDDFIDLNFPILNGSLNNTGKVALRTSYIGSHGGSSEDSGIVVGNGNTLTQIARAGQPSPDGNGILSYVSIPDINDAGQVAFAATLIGSNSSLTSDVGVYRNDGNVLTQIARTGQAAPDGNGIIGRTTTFHGSSLNALGQVAFGVAITPTPDGIGGDEALLLGDGDKLIQIVRSGQPAPDGNGDLVYGQTLGLAAPALNEMGQVAFSAYVTGTVDGLNDGGGVFLSDGSSLTTIARRGQPAPDGNGSFGTFSTPRSLNNSGQVAFRAGFIDSSLGFTDRGIVRGDGVTLEQIARHGQLAPDGDGTYREFYHPAINDAGQVVFGAVFLGGQNIPRESRNGDRAIVFYDDELGLVPVARVGDPLLGSTIVDFNFHGTEKLGFNERGQVAFQFFLEDYRRGIAIWSPVPEPGAITYLALAGGGLFTCFRRGL